MGIAIQVGRGSFSAAVGTMQFIPFFSYPAINAKPSHSILLTLQTKYCG